MAGVPSSVGVGEPAVVTKRIDNTRVVTSEGQVERQVIGVADPLDPDARAQVAAAEPDGAAFGLVTRNIPSGTQDVRPPAGATGTVTPVAAAMASVTLLAANDARLGAMIYNDSTATLFVKFGAAASAASFTAKVFGDGLFVIPAGYTGRIDGVWDAAIGNALVTEVTA